MEFREQRDIETGFAAIFETEIVPKLTALEQSRSAGLQALNNRKWPTIAVTAALALAALFYIPFALNLIIVAIVLAAGYVAWIFIASPLHNDWEAKINEIIMSPICRHVGELRVSLGGGHDLALPQVRALNLIPKYTSSGINTEMEGSYRNTVYRFGYVTLSQSGYNYSQTVFRGFVFRISVPEPVPSRIIMIRELGGILDKIEDRLSGTIRNKIPEASIDHPEFARAFAVYADDPQVVRAFLPPAFFDILLSLSRMEGSKGEESMAAAFEGDWFYLTLSREPIATRSVDLHTSTSQVVDAIHDIFSEVALVRRIIDQLHGDDATPG